MYDKNGGVVFSQNDRYVRLVDNLPFSVNTTASGSKVPMLQPNLHPRNATIKESLVRLHTMLSKPAHLLPVFGKLDPEAATGGGLSHTTLSTDEYPLESVLVYDVFEGGLGEVGVVKFSHCFVIVWNSILVI